MHVSVCSMFSAHCPPPADLSVINQSDVSTDCRVSTVILTKAFVSAKASVLLKQMRAQFPNSVLVNFNFYCKSMNQNDL